MMERILVRFIHPQAKLPAKMTKGSAGHDLYAAEKVVIPASKVKENGGVDIGRALVSTGLEIALSEHVVGRIASRSGLSVKHNIEVGAGWIDSDYRGPLLVELKNFSSVPFRINPGDRIAQLILINFSIFHLKLVEELPRTERGPSGFGSTGQ